MTGNKKLDFLVGLYIACMLMAEVMGSKVFVISESILLFGRPLSASVGIFLIPILFSINDIVTEVYGKARARSIIRTGLYILIFYAIFTFMAIHLPTSARSPLSQVIFEEVFYKSIRITLASITAFFVSEFMDVFVYSRIREMFGKSHLWFRNNLSNFVGQFLDTTLFIILAFYAFDQGWNENMGFLFSLIIPYWLLKCCMSIIETPFVYLGINWLKKEN
jgi:queuosine precursor transporter